MSIDASLPPLGSEVLTACQGRIRLESSTPHVLYKGMRIYFCLPDCKKTFEEDPKASCLAGHPLLDEDE